MNKIGSKIYIKEVQTWMDGGSVTLNCIDEKGLKFQIEFIQNVAWEIYDTQRLPGRVYLEGEIVDQRSEIEIFIINLLDEALVRLNKDEQIILKEKLSYIGSKDYLDDVNRIVILERKITP